MMKKDFIMHEMMYHADNEEYEEEHSRIEVSSIKSKRLVPFSSQYLPKNAKFIFWMILPKNELLVGEVLTTLASLSSGS